MRSTVGPGTGLRRNLPAIGADRRLVKLAIKQLLDNALKYSPPDTPVTIRLHDGNGVSPWRSPIMARGYQSRSRVAFSNGCTEVLPCSIRYPARSGLEHRPEHRAGTSWRSDRNEPSRGDHVPTDIAGGSQGRTELSAGRILVVDDEPQIRRIMRTTLTGAGYEVDDAKTGEEGLEKVREFRPDLVLLDINMPGMGGLAACRAIRADPNVAIIMLTVQNTEADKVEALDAGADDFVTKPFSTPELLARIRAALRRVPVSAQSSPARIRVGPAHDRLRRAHRCVTEPRQPT